MKRQINQGIQWLSEGVDPFVLALFRIVYGLFMTYEMIDYYKIGLIRNMFFLPAINFKYDFLHWLMPLPEMWMNLILGLLIACALAIALGVFFKWSCRIFALGYAYIFLLDKSIYNNHIYLFILLAILLSFTDADRFLSLRKRPIHIVQVPRWQPFILQLQILIVYFYGGIAKIKYDWLVEGQPVRSLIDQLPGTHWLAPLFKNDFGVYLLTYGGFLIDIGAPFLLWYKPVRRWAIFPFIAFHFSNSNIFSDIGIFPFIMMFSLILYFETQEIPFLRRFAFSSPGVQKNKATSGSDKSVILNWGNAFAFNFLIIYFSFQFLFPFRGHFLPNDLDWTTIGNRFSWRMKVDTRSMKEMEFSVFDPDNDVMHPVNIHSLVNDMQIMNLYMDPRSVADFSKLLKIKAEQSGIKNPQVKAKIRVAYNGRAEQYFVDPDRDLAAVSYHFYEKLNWVFPVTR